MINVNLNKIDRMAGLTFKNVLRLHFDSILLYKNNSFPSSFFLSVLAMEELGKYYMIDHFLFHSRVDGRMGEEWDRKWLDDIFNHKRKQMTFASTNRFELSNSFLKTVYEGKLEIEKQNSVYVGLPKLRREMNLKGRIINPFRISHSKSKKQITLLNDNLLEQCLIVIKEVGSLDSYYAEDIINIELVELIESSWKFKSKKTLNRINQLKKFV
jgi:AbiV family abortive infection protein